MKKNFRNSKNIIKTYYALTSFSFNQFAYVNKDKDLLLIKEIDKNQLFAYRLYKKQSY